MSEEQPLIDFSQIPEYEMKALCRTLLQSCREFYSDPKNVEKFERWKAERDKENRKEVKWCHEFKTGRNQLCDQRADSKIGVQTGSGGCRYGDSGL